MMLAFGRFLFVWPVKTLVYFVFRSFASLTKFLLSHDYIIYTLFSLNKIHVYS
jgi:hypothetical protein